MNLVADDDQKIIAAGPSWYYSHVYSARFLSSSAKDTTMATGACGIDCSTCRLHRRGKCSSCGPATGGLAAAKLAAQERLLGSPCPILACARLNRLDYCLADCDQFPCENFRGGPYPFSQPFLNMQQRRRAELEKQELANRLPPQHWQTLDQRPRAEIDQLCDSVLHATGPFHLTAFNEQMRLDPGNQRVEVWQEGGWKTAPQLPSLVALVYLAQGRSSALTGRWVSPLELDCASFFKGRYELPFARVLAQFGNDPEQFLVRCRHLGATPVNDRGDVAVRLWLLPQIPIKLILWSRDDELPAALTLLFDASIEQFLPADGIWAMVQVLSDRLLADKPDEQPRNRRI